MNYRILIIIIPLLTSCTSETYDTIALSLFGFVLVGFLILLICLIYASLHE